MLELYHMAKNSFRTLTLSRDEEDRLYEAWKEFESKAPAYARFQLRPENCVITCYESGKTLFQGSDADVYASPFMNNETLNEKTESVSSVTKGNSRKIILPQAGSDEVGTGDYFGPVCVCAAIVTADDIALLEKLGIRDSKQINDETIRKAAPQLMKQLIHSLLIVDNARYNRVHETANLNKIKAMLHNQAYLNLGKITALPDFRIIDQFEPEISYYRHLRSQPDVVRGIHFETKAEDKYPSVGAASVIARYAFLTYMDALEKQYGMHFAKGGGKQADQSGIEFISKYGEEKLGEVAKLHFANTQKILKAR